MLRVNIQDVLEVIETVQQGLNHGINGKGYGR